MNVPAILSGFLAAPTVQFPPDALFEASLGEPNPVRCDWKQARRRPGASTAAASPLRPKGAGRVGKKKIVMSVGETHGRLTFVEYAGFDEETHSIGRFGSTHSRSRRDDLARYATNAELRRGGVVPPRPGRAPRAVLVLLRRRPDCLSPALRHAARPCRASRAPGGFRSPWPDRAPL